MRKPPETWLDSFLQDPGDPVHSTQSQGLHGTEITDQDLIDQLIINTDDFTHLLIKDPEFNPEQTNQTSGPHPPGTLGTLKQALHHG